MNDREKLISMIFNGQRLCTNSLCHGCEQLADHIIANGVVVREKGEWRNNKDDYPECTRCGYMPQYDPMIDDIYYSDFCPNCGADMRVELALPESKTMEFKRWRYKDGEDDGT